MSTGYVVVEFKAPDDGPPIKVPRSVASSKVWKKIAELADLALGVTSFAAELGWDNPTVKPPNMKVEWRKAGGSDPSKRHALVVGTERAGASTVTVIERIDASDLPISLWMWQDAPTGQASSDVLVTKCIVKAWNPVAQIVAALDGK